MPLLEQIHYQLHIELPHKHHHQEEQCAHEDLQHLLRQIQNNNISRSTTINTNTSSQLEHNKCQDNNNNNHFYDNVPSNIRSCKRIHADSIRLIKTKESYLSRHQYRNNNNNNHHHHETNPSFTSTSNNNNSHQSITCELLAIPLPQEITTTTSSRHDNDGDDNTTIYNECSNDTILHDILPCIHPDLSHLYPCGLLESHFIPDYNTKKMTTTATTKTTTTTASRQKQPRNEFQLLLLAQKQHMRNDTSYTSTTTPPTTTGNPKHEENNKSAGSHYLSSSSSSQKGKYHGVYKSSNKSSNQGNNTTTGMTNEKEGEKCSSVPSLQDILLKINGQGMVGAPNRVIGALYINCIHFSYGNSTTIEETKEGHLHVNNTSTTTTNNNTNTITTTTTTTTTAQNDDGTFSFYEFPLCPICRFRIEPFRLLGIPPNSILLNNDPNNPNNRRCSDGCSSEGKGLCENMQFLPLWPSPTFCVTCHVLEERLNASGAQPFYHAASIPSSSSSSSSRLLEDTTMEEENSDSNDGTRTEITTTATTTTAAGRIECFNCAMQETLWVCLTCGTIGCGRYSHAHAEEHYLETGHPYSMELATQRIWDYATSAFIQRNDLLNCPFMQQSLGAKNRLAYHHASYFGGANGGSFDDDDDDDGKHKGRAITSNYNGEDDILSTKKSFMLGSEYEALLQSAMEDQAQHYEGEIARYSAELAGESIDEKQMTEAEKLEVKDIESDIAELRVQIEELSNTLLHAKKQEGVHRSKSNTLLRQQSIAKECLDQIRAEVSKEQAEGKHRMEELDLQITDLTTNLRMRQQISKDRELVNSRIYGTSGKKKGHGKKKGRGKSGGRR